MTDINATIASLTAKGREAMTKIGRGQVSYFDEGIAEDSGSWGSALSQDLGLKGSGVLNGLRDQGLLNREAEDEVGDAGFWWSLTALGAEVANHLAMQNTDDTNDKKENTMTATTTTEPTATNRGRKPMTLGAADGKRITRTKTYKVADVAALCDISNAAVLRWIRLGYLPATKEANERGRQVMHVAGADLADFLKTRKAEAVKKTAKA